MFCKQIDFQNDSSAKVAYPPDTSLLSREQDTSLLSREQLDAELEKGYADISAGRAIDAKTVFTDIRTDHPQIG